MSKCHGGASASRRCAVTHARSSAGLCGHPALRGPISVHVQNRALPPAPSPSPPTAPRGAPAGGGAGFPPLAHVRGDTRSQTKEPKTAADSAPPPGSPTEPAALSPSACTRAPFCDCSRQRSRPSRPPLPPAVLLVSRVTASAEPYFPSSSFHRGLLLVRSPSCSGAGGPFAPGSAAAAGAATGPRRRFSLMWFLTGQGQTDQSDSHQVYSDFSSRKRRRAKCFVTSILGRFTLRK